MRILIADDNELIRRGVADILSAEPELEVCGEASDGPGTLDKSRELRPDMVLLDISMPGPNGYETARLLRQRIPEIRILIMSFGDPLQLLPLALEAGADQCVDKARLALDLLPIVKGFLTAPYDRRDAKEKYALADHAEYSAGGNRQAKTAGHTD